jgi:hypothetical protein
MRLFAAMASIDASFLRVKRSNLIEKPLTSVYMGRARSESIGTGARRTQADRPSKK